MLKPDFAPVKRINAKELGQCWDSAAKRISQAAQRDCPQMEDHSRGHRKACELFTNRVTAILNILAVLGHRVKVAAVRAGISSVGAALWYDSGARRRVSIRARPTMVATPAADRCPNSMALIFLPRCLSRQDSLGHGRTRASHSGWVSGWCEASADLKVVI